MNAAWAKRTAQIIAVSVLVMFGLVAGRAVASAVFDQINGKVIPTTLNATYTFAGGTIPSCRTHNSGTVTLAVTDDVLVVGAGTAETVNLPATPTAGKVWTVIHANGTVATNVVALGAASGFSINGAASHNALDAAGNSMVIVGTATGYAAGVNN